MILGLSWLNIVGVLRKTQQPRSKTGRRVFATDGGCKRRIKRVQRLAGGELYLISDNEHYKPEMIKP